VPASFTIRTDKTIGRTPRRSPRMATPATARGIDHFIDVYGNTLIGIVFEATGH
jgi:hypothetical protein